MSTWQRIEAWIEAQASPLRAALGPPASEQDLRRAEQALRVELPETFKDLYRVHDGERGYVGLLGGRELLSIERILDEWNVWKGLLDGGDFVGIESQPEGPIRRDWWNPRWIPISHNGAGDHLCLDLDPASGGIRGQIIEFWHDAAERRVVAPGIGELMEGLATDLEAGRYVWREGSLEPV